MAKKKKKKNRKDFFNVKMTPYTNIFAWFYMKICLLNEEFTPKSDRILEKVQFLKICVFHTLICVIPMQVPLPLWSKDIIISPPPHFLGHARNHFDGILLMIMSIIFVFVSGHFKANIVNKKLELTLFVLCLLFISSAHPVWAPSCVEKVFQVFSVVSYTT